MRGVLIRGSRWTVRVIAVGLCVMVHGKSDVERRARSDDTLESDFALEFLNDLLGGGKAEPRSSMAL